MNRTVFGSSDDNSHPKYFSEMLLRSEAVECLRQHVITDAEGQRYIFPGQQRDAMVTVQNIYQLLLQGKSLPEYACTL